MKPLLLRLCLIGGAAFLALLAGTWLGGVFLVPKDLGLAAPAVALAYGLFAAVTVAIIVGVLAFRLHGRVLVRASLAAGGLAMATVGVLAFMIIRAGDAQNDPEADYAGVPRFSVHVEQIVVTDPYLRIAMTVDSRSRRWRSVGPAPAKQVCEGAIRAQRLKNVWSGLSALASAAPDALAQCAAERGGATQRIVWEIEPGATLADGVVLAGRLDVSPSCLAEAAAVARVIATVGMASESTVSRIKCD